MTTTVTLSLVGPAGKGKTTLIKVIRPMIEEQMKKTKKKKK